MRAHKTNWSLSKEQIIYAYLPVENQCKLLLFTSVMHFWYFHPSTKMLLRMRRKKHEIKLYIDFLNVTHPVCQDCYRVLVSLKSWPGQLLSLFPCLRPKILARMLFFGILSLKAVILDITAFFIVIIGENKPMHKKYNIKNRYFWELQYTNSVSKTSCADHPAPVVSPLYVCL